MQKELYTKHIEWQVWICGEGFSLSPSLWHDGQRLLYIQELRKNGQEDTHQAGDAMFENGAWVWVDDDGGHMFDKYGIGSDKILEFLNENPVPDEMFSPIT